MILRPYKKSDNPYIYEILPQDEKGFFMWCAGNLIYPLNHDDYERHMEVIEKDSNVFSMTCVDGCPIGNVVFTVYEERVHFRFVVAKRGKGKEMLRLALNYAFVILNKAKATLKVYKDNPRAIGCYKAVGFIVEEEHENYYDLMCTKE